MGIATTQRFNRWKEKQEKIEKIMALCQQTSIKPKEINHVLEKIDTTPLHTGIKLAELIARPQISIDQIINAIPKLKEYTEKIKNRHEEIIESAEIKIKYQGYIEREKIVAEKMHRLENITIKGRFKYAKLHELSTEARQKLEHIDPETLAQASRIPGVSPSDINVLLILLGR